MVDRAVYTLRGWLAFVAFIEISQTLRSWREKDIFLGAYIYSESTSSFTENSRVPVPPTTARCLICYSAINAAILMSCAFCIHQWSTIMMSAFALILKCIYLLYESLGSRTMPLNFHVIFPIVVYGVTILLLAYAPVLLRQENIEIEENEEILKKHKGPPIDLLLRRKSGNKKMKTL